MSSAKSLEGALKEGIKAVFESGRFLDFITRHGFYAVNNRFFMRELLTHFNRISEREKVLILQVLMIGRPDFLPQVRDFVKAALKDKSPRVRSLAVRALPYFSSGSAVGELIGVFRNRNEQVTIRKEAMELAVKAVDRRSIKDLVVALLRTINEDLSVEAIRSHASENLWKALRKANEDALYRWTLFQLVKIFKLRGLKNLTRDLYELFIRISVKVDRNLPGTVLNDLNSDNLQKVASSLNVISAANGVFLELISQNSRRKLAKRLLELSKSDSAPIRRSSLTLLEQVIRRLDDQPFLEEIARELLKMSDGRRLEEFGIIPVVMAMGMFPDLLTYNLRALVPKLRSREVLREITDRMLKALEESSSTDSVLAVLALVAGNGWSHPSDRERIFLVFLSLLKEGPWWLRSNLALKIARVWAVSTFGLDSGLLRELGNALLENLQDSRCRLNSLLALEKLALKFGDRDFKERTVKVLLDLVGKLNFAKEEEELEVALRILNGIASNTAGKQENLFTFIISGLKKVGLGSGWNVVSRFRLQACEKILRKCAVAGEGRSREVKRLLAGLRGLFLLDRGYRVVFPSHRVLFNFFEPNTVRTDFILFVGKRFYRRQKGKLLICCGA